MHDRPLRIAIIASNHHPIAQPFAGGLEAHVWHLSRALRAAGHDVTLFAGPGSDVDGATRVLHADDFAPSSAAAHDVSMPSNMAMRDHHAYLALMMELTAHPDRFDVVHNHSLHYLPVAMGPVVTTPMITTLHTPPTPWLESALTVAPHTRCVAVSNHTARSWSHILGDTPVIHNGIRVDDWPAGSGGDDLVWFGRLVPEKGPHAAIAAARIAGQRLRLVGPISDRRYFTEMIAPHLDDRITYLGHLRHEALAEVVGAAAVTLVTPLWNEPYGLVVAESLACGTPVASFDRGGIPEIVNPDVGILVPPDDVDALAQAAHDAGQLDRRTVRIHAVTHCAHEVMVDRYQDLYRTLVAEQAMPV